MKWGKSCSKISFCHVNMGNKARERGKKTFQFHEYFKWFQFEQKICSKKWKMKNIIL
jgi:hypothetical protein